MYVEGSENGIIINEFDGLIGNVTAQTLELLFQIVLATQTTIVGMSVLGFELEWFDEVSGILQTLYLKFFLDDNTIELLKGTSTFLKRIFYPEVKLSDLFIGNSITV